MKKKTKTITLWISFAITQILFFVLLFVKGLEWIWLLAIIGLVSLILISFCIKNLSKKLLLICLLAFVNIISSCIIKDQCARVIVVYNTTKYKIKWIKGTDYLTSNNKKVQLQKGIYYVDNATDRPMEIYTIQYGKNPYSFSYDGFYHSSAQIKPHSVTKIGQKPNYILRTPPSSVASPMNHETRLWLRFIQDYDY